MVRREWPCHGANGPNTTQADITQRRGPQNGPCGGNPYNRPDGGRPRRPFYVAIENALNGASAPIQFLHRARGEPYPKIAYKWRREGFAAGFFTAPDCPSRKRALRPVAPYITMAIRRFRLFRLFSGADFVFCVCSSFALQPTLVSVFLTEVSVLFFFEFLPTVTPDAITGDWDFDH